MKKKSFKQIRDTIYNNPRADRQDKDNDDKIEDENKRMTLYDGNDIQTKMIDRIIRAYQAKKLLLKAQEIQKGNIEEGRSDLIKKRSLPRLVILSMRQSSVSGHKFAIRKSKNLK